MGRAKLEQAAPALSFADRGFGERDLATFLRLGSGFNEESLDWFDKVDEIEVQKEGEGRRSLLFTVWLSKQKSCVSAASPTHMETPR